MVLVPFLGPGYEAGARSVRLGRTSSDKCRLGRVVDPLSLQLAQAGHGLYFHVAVEGGKQTTETIPPRRIFDTIGKFVKKKVIPTLPFPCSHFVRFHRLDETEPHGWNQVQVAVARGVGLTPGVRNARRHGSSS